MPAPLPPETAADLTRARAGDGPAFERLVAPHRRELLVHLYRMTGSWPEAEDLLQESLVRAWRGLAGFEGRASLRRWLYRVATNTCLNAVGRRRPRVLPTDMGPAASLGEAPAGPLFDPVWLDPCPEIAWMAAPPAGPGARIGARESVTLAFLAAIQNLPASQRAVLLLRDVLGFSAAQTAETLDLSVAAANSALQRARATLAARRERLDTLDAPADAEVEALLARYVGAWERGDVEALAALLREDASLSMPPVPTWYAGRQAIAAFLAPLLAHMGRFRLRTLTANGGPAAAAWLCAPGEEVFRAQALHVLTVDEGGIARMDVFMDPRVFARFGLPAAL
jgi:RNA polymerase sigma-70 factor (ECF subfamily)